MERSGVLPTTQFSCRKGLGTCGTLLCVSNTLQSSLESGQEARIVQINFSTASDRVDQDGVNHQGILYKLCSVSIGCSVLSMLTQFLSNLSHRRSKLVTRCTRNAGGKCFGVVIVPSVHFVAFFHSGS